MEFHATADTIAMRLVPLPGQEGAIEDAFRVVRQTGAAGGARATSAEGLAALVAACLVVAARRR